VAIVRSNGLYGTNGVQPTSSTIALTGSSPFTTNNTRLLYDNTHQLRGRNPIRFATDYRRTSTGTLRYSLPNTGPWSARWYVWMPPLQDAGYGINEVRWHVGFPGSGLGFVTHATAAGNAGTRLQPNDLNAAAITWDTEGGSAVPTNQWWRVELSYNGTNFVSSIYAGDATAGARVHTWNNRDVGRSMELTAYRYRRGVMVDSTSDSAQIQSRQNQLIVLGYLPSGAADGIWGPQTAGAISSFQGDYGLQTTSTVTTETGAAMDLAVNEANGATLPTPLWIANLTITDTADPVGPLDLESAAPSPAGVQLTPSVLAENTSLAVDEEVDFTPGVTDTSKAVDVAAAEEVEFSPLADLYKETSTAAAAGVHFTPTLTYSSSSLIPDPPGIGPSYRLAIYEPNGALRGYLPHTISWNASFVFNDTGSLTLNCNRNVPGTEILDNSPFEVALEFRRETSANFVEAFDGRFLSMRRTRDLADRSGNFTWTCPSYSWIFRKIKTLSGTTERERVFTNVRVGAIIRGLVDDWRDRGDGGVMSTVFNANTDTFGNMWAGGLFSMTIPDGTSLYDVMISLSDSGMVDWRMSNRGFQAFNPDTAMNRDMTGSVHLRMGRNLLEAPEDFTYEELAGRMDVAYDNGGVSTANTTRMAPWGRWEEYGRISGVNSSATATLLIQRRMAEAIPRTQRMRRHLVMSGDPVPMLDYQPGDVISVDEPGASGENTFTANRRIRQIIVSHGQDRLMETALTLEHRFVPKELRLDHKTRSAGGYDFVGGAAVWRAL